MTQMVHTWKIVDTESEVNCIVLLCLCSEYKKPPHSLNTALRSHTTNIFLLNEHFLGANIHGSSSLILAPNLQCEYHCDFSFQKNGYRCTEIGDCSLHCLQGTKLGFEQRQSP